MLMGYFVAPLFVVKCVLKHLPVFFLVFWNAPCGGRQRWMSGHDAHLRAFAVAVCVCLLPCMLARHT